MEKLWIKVARPEEKILQLLFFSVEILKYNAWKYYIVEKSPTSPNPDTECLMHLQRGLKTCSSFQYSIRFVCSTLSSPSSNKPASRQASVSRRLLSSCWRCAVYHYWLWVWASIPISGKHLCCLQCLYVKMQQGCLRVCFAFTNTNWEVSRKYRQRLKALPEGGSVWYVRLGRNLVW